MSGRTSKIDLGYGRFAIVDEGDLPALSKFKWYYSGGYAAMWADKKQTGMHRLVIGASSNEHVDHINGNRLDNRRANLRIATRWQNQANRGPVTGKKFKGTCFDKSKGRWMASCGRVGQPRFVGYFDTEEDAARAYDKKAREVFGQFARTNFEE